MVNDYEIPMPRWELTDPFGRNAIKRIRYELKKCLCERDGYKAQVESILTEQGNAVNMLAKALAREQEMTKEYERRLRVCDEARKSLGEKNSKVKAENDSLKHDNIALRADLAKLQYEYDELTEQHEKLIRGMTDKGVEA